MSILLTSTLSQGTTSTNITLPIAEDAALKQTIAPFEESPVELEVELTNKAGNTTVQKRIISADKVAEA